ncbi:hypothetical protein C0J52_09344 [Blattella germanica]|nr:hypothetical protein C0J52_09344 [Blattella germanica]
MATNIPSIKKTQTLSEIRIFSPRLNTMRNVSLPAGNVRKSGQILKNDATMKNLNKLYSMREVSQTVRNSRIGAVKSKSSLLNRNIMKGSNRGYITLLDQHRLENRSTAVSRILPQKELLPNVHHHKFHIAQWESWLTSLPKWMRDAALEERRKTHYRIPDKENRCPNLDESANSSYTTIEDEVLDSSDFQELEPIIEDSLPDILKTSRKQWRDWSIQLSDGKLLITGKADNEIFKSEDVSSGELIDPNNLRFNNGMVYELIGMPDHFTNLPYYVRNKFQVGFPEDWKVVKDRWMDYIEQGSPFDFNWSSNSNELSSNVTLNPSKVKPPEYACSVTPKTPQKNTSYDEVPLTSENVSFESMYKNTRISNVPRSPLLTEQYKRAYSTFSRQSIVKGKTSSSMKLDSDILMDDHPDEDGKKQSNLSAKSVKVEHSKSEISASSTDEKPTCNLISELPVESTGAENADSETLVEVYDSKLNNPVMLLSKNATKNNKSQKRQAIQQGLHIISNAEVLANCSGEMEYCSLMLKPHNMSYRQ